MLIIINSKFEKEIKKDSTNKEWGNIRRTDEEINRLFKSTIMKSYWVIEDAGGYVVVVEKIEDFKEIMDKAYINCDTVIAEYVDKIVCSDGEVYTNSLIFCNNDYAIPLIIPIQLTPQNLKDYMID